MDVGISLVGNVELEDPIDHGEIESPCCNVGAEQHSVSLLAKGEVDGHAFLLLLVALQFVQRTAQLELPQGFVQETDLLAGGDEDYYLLLVMGLEEGVESVQLFLCRHNHVVLG